MALCQSVNATVHYCCVVSKCIYFNKSKFKSKKRTLKHLMVLHITTNNYTYSSHECYSPVKTCSANQTGPILT